MFDDFWARFGRFFCVLLVDLGLVFGVVFCFLFGFCRTFASCFFPPKHPGPLGFLGIFSVAWSCKKKQDLSSCFILIVLLFSSGFETFSLCCFAARF